MSCEYCERLNGLVTANVEFEAGHGIESSTSHSVFAHIMKNRRDEKYFFVIDENYSECFEIQYCPKCGRKLVEE